MKKGICLLLCALLLCAPWAGAETVRGNLEERFGGAPAVEYEGVSYRLRSRLTTILLAGIDQYGEKEQAAAGSEYRSGGQADFLLLLVIDDNRDTAAALQIDRDTMAEITVLSVLGVPSGTRTAQICLAHSFGDGEEQSCRLLTEAVSRFLLGVPIDYYAAMNLDGIAALNDALGGVEVTLEDDFTAFDPQMKPGETITLMGEQAEIFVRSRHYVGDQTNRSRLARQRIYLDAAAEKLLAQLEASAGFANTMYAAAEPFIVTDMSKGRIVNLADSIGRYERLPIAVIDGAAVLGESGVMEFYPDEASKMQAVLELFFEPAA